MPKRSDSVPHATRWCAQCKDNTEHAQYTSGKCGSMLWSCMPCARRRRRELDQRIAEGTHTVTHRETTTEQPRVCQMHFIELSRSGSCPGCEDEL